MRIGLLSFDSRESGILVLNIVKDRRESGIKNPAARAQWPSLGTWYAAERADSAR